MSKHNLQTIALRGAATFAVATAGMCLYCAIRDLETIPFGFIVSGFVAPSIVLYLVLEYRSPTRWPRLIAFLVPSAVIMGGCYYLYLGVRKIGAEQGVSDGGDLLLFFFLQIYLIGCCFALAFLTFLSRKNVRSDRNPDHEGESK